MALILWTTLFFILDQIISTENPTVTYFVVYVQPGHSAMELPIYKSTNSHCFINSYHSINFLKMLTSEPCGTVRRAASSSGCILPQSGEAELPSSGDHIPVGVASSPVVHKSPSESCCRWPWPCKPSAPRQTSVSVLCSPVTDTFKQCESIYGSP